MLNPKHKSCNEHMLYVAVQDAHARVRLKNAEKVGSPFFASRQTYIEVGIRHIEVLKFVGERKSVVDKQFTYKYLPDGNKRFDVDCLTLRL